MKQALCVGINIFRNYPAAALRGCVGDALAMSDLIRQYRGFEASDNVDILLDRSATKHNILSALGRMIGDAVDGKCDYIGFSLSSHGTQIPDISGDEPDGLDEAFCMYDLAGNDSGWNPDTLIIDDELAGIFKPIPSNVQVEIFLDTCHSGTGLRDLDMLFTRAPRFIPAPSLDAYIKIEGKKARRKRTVTVPENTKQILWSSCLPNQTSADAYINGAWRGAFTYYLAQEMHACNGQLPNAELLKNIKTKLKEGRYTQVPTVEMYER